MAEPAASTSPTSGGALAKVLDFIEKLGNKLPEPALIFAGLAVVVVIASFIGAKAGWTVQPVRVVGVYEMTTNAQGQAVKKLDANGKPIPVLGADGRQERTTENVGAPLTPRNLLTIEGVYWMLSSMVRNFTGLPALGLVFVAMLGIGLAEKFGLFGALMRWLAILTPRKLLTPVIVFIGANSSVASDAGYIILPPLAAALYLAMGRSPIAGLAAAFAGVAGGFGGGLFPTAADGFLAGVATQAAHIIDPSYPAVQAVHNQFFKMGSAVVVMLAGWFVTDVIIEPRLLKRQSDSQDTSAITSMALNATEKKGLAAAGVVLAIVLGTFAAMIFTPGAPLYGTGMPTLANGQIPSSVSAKFHEGVTLPTVGAPSTSPALTSPTATPTIPPERALLVVPPETKNGVTTPGWMVEQVAGSKPAVLERPSDRWSQVIVPVIFLSFLLPGMAYGLVTGALRKQADFIDALYHGIKSIVPILAISFFLGQFVNYFTYTGLDRMLAFAGGKMLIAADLPIPLLVVLFVLLVIAGDFAMSGMLSKFGVMAPIFIPMFMMVGISPELTTAAYRIGDSVVNIITPLNSYLLIILVVLQKYQKNAGLGSLISLMLPYSIVFGIIWTGFLLLWMATGQPLGPDAPLWAGLGK
ncbi:MAG: AbgT family transporter [Phycisphaerales bacterium]|nr:AbgT family transporter [Phycisphaerales bacterium]